MAAAWIIVNLLMALTGLAPGTGGAAIAWEAHLFGYAAGLVLIGPAVRIMRTKTDNTIE
jgi:membrane associated rhomboid family serine protease